MTDIIFATLAVYFIQLVLPTIIGVARGEVDLGYLLGPRDEPAEATAHVGRARRAASNMGESLLIFLPLAILAGNNGAAAEAATIWLGLRIAYLVTYVLGLRHVRTIIWFASIVYLYFMFAALG